MKTIIQCLFLAVVMTGCSSLSKEQISACNNTSCATCPACTKMEKRQKPVTDIIDLSHSGVRSSQIITYLAYSQTNITPIWSDRLRNRRESAAM